ncbi:hypothetical protein A3L09_04665 [Thermococcus profundus]|uniref:Thil AANH domain-containing protein n=1 Tax=Thermococcus profundus TaxID=49899 RepID=A0A2Z2MJJ1_THEPR|nr:hypothetical protein [Thermococcus profundus]ASJ02601.1 hypothetical protein A3L09_04665 [Thermococcus profundus]
MRAVALLSSGIDSPVAIYLMLRKGIEVVPVHFRQDAVKEGKVLEIIDVLRRYGKLGDPIVVDFSEEHIPAFRRLQEIGKTRYTCVLCKWLMVRKACQVGHEIGAQALIMGDSLGQVASQTLDNLLVVSSVSDLPILRPLIGFDKEEIVGIAKAIGTFEISSRREPPCPFTPKYPVVRASFAEFLDITRAVRKVL